MEIDFEHLNENGYQAGALPTDGAEAFQIAMLSFAHKLGVPVPSRSGGPIIDALRPQPKHGAHSRSLSACFEMGEFPFHTDTAYKPEPCRYLLLGCLDPGPGNRPTILLDGLGLNLSPSDLVTLKSSPFQIRNGRHSFFSTILSDTTGKTRFDEACMIPMLDSSRLALKIFKSRIEAASSEAIGWKRGNILIIDNWRMLHARGRSDGNLDDSARNLLRISIQ